MSDTTRLDLTRDHREKEYVVTQDVIVVDRASFAYVVKAGTKITISEPQGPPRLDPEAI